MARVNQKIKMVDGCSCLVLAFVPLPVQQPSTPSWQNRKWFFCLFCLFFRSGFFYWPRGGGALPRHFWVPACLSTHPIPGSVFWPKIGKAVPEYPRTPGGWPSAKKEACFRYHFHMLRDAQIAYFFHPSPNVCVRFVNLCKKKSIRSLSFSIFWLFFLVSLLCGTFTRPQQLGKGT